MKMKQSSSVAPNFFCATDQVHAILWQTGIEPNQKKWLNTQLTSALSVVAVMEDNVSTKYWYLDESIILFWLP